MKRMFKINPASLIAVIIIAGITYSCKKDDNNNNNGKTDPGTIAAANLIAYFPFDNEPAGGAAVANSNNQIKFVRKVGTGSFVTGRRGQAYQGTNAQSYLEYDVVSGSAFSTLDEFSIACWIKTPATTSGAAKIFGLNGGDPFMGNLDLIQESQPTGDSVDMKLYLYDSASPEWKGQDIRKNSKEFVNDKWFHLVALYRKSSSTMEFYANGKKVFSQIRYAGPVPVSGTQPLLEGIKLGSDMSKIYFGAWVQQIAGTPDTWMTYYKGLVDEFRIYNKALSDDELMSLYEAEVSQISQ